MIVSPVIVLVEMSIRGPLFRRVPVLAARNSGTASDRALAALASERSRQIEHPPLKMQGQREVGGGEPGSRIFVKRGKFLLRLGGRRGYTFSFSRLLVQDGGLAIRYLPHLKSAVGLVIHENSLSISEQETGSR